MVMPNCLFIYCLLGYLSFIHCVQLFKKGIWNGPLFISLFVCLLGSLLSKQYVQLFKHELGMAIYLIINIV